MKIITMYLPQYHRVKENDEWWGEGYTDWVSTRDAKQLYDGHYQPHVPMDDYYYNLLDKKTLEWQANLMKKYGIDGQCIYHYWFKDGKQILEKPAENLLKWTDIDMPYCFSWANQSWANSWSAVKNANVWCDGREKQKAGSGSGLLLEQEYGDRKEWIKHFNYLLPFFRDARYIKYDNKPVFVLYQAMYIDVLKDMRDCWNALAIDNGFAGIYFIGANNKDESLVDNVLYPAPQTAMSLLLDSAKVTNGLRQPDCQEIWNGLIKNALIYDNGTTGAFTGYDDSPRRGAKGVEVVNNDPVIFKDNLTKILALNEYNGQEYTFINAWNEWGEGMHLEPDSRYGYEYLEGIRYAKDNYKHILESITDLGIKDIFSDYRMKNIVLDKKIRQYRNYWTIFDRWMILKEGGKSLSDAIISRGYKQIAIYGIGMLGRHLLAELSGSDIEIVCTFDRKNSDNEYGIPVCDIDDYNQKFDLIIVTVDYDYDSIKDDLIDKGMENIVSISEVLNWCEDN